MAAPPAARGILTVSEVTRRIKAALAEPFRAVWVRGEISNLRRAPSGHLYFCLKDDRAMLECMMWSSDLARLAFAPRDGVEVEAFGGITVYEPKGRYQLYAETMRVAGVGALLAALEDLKQHLQAEGLFDPARKRPLPRYPGRIGLVTSPVGAAARDLIKVLRARWPSISLVLAPVRVQGEGAAAEIASAIERFNRVRGADLLIVGRGGGSLEDLWAFNEERVVRAVAASAIPVISAVGHEADVTLADLAADVRAATPSNAGELAVPDRREARRHLEALRRRLESAVGHALEDRRRRLEELLAKHGFRRPRDVFRFWGQRLDELAERLRRQARRTLEGARLRLERARAAYGLREWPQRLGRRRAEVARLARRLEPALLAALARRRLQWAGGQDRLRALSPRRVLERGYCLVRGPDGTLLRSAAGLAVGDRVQVEFARGEAEARIEAVRGGEEHDG
jgi:exodeoxyribonuclease VII large subunit